MPIEPADATLEAGRGGTVVATVLPEPAPVSLLILALGGLLVWNRRPR